MKRYAPYLGLIMVLSACASPTVVSDAPEDQTSQIMATAIEQLITEDHTFGEGPPPFTEYLIQTQTDPEAGAVGEPPQAESRPLATYERDAIEAVVDQYGPVRWIDGPDEWRTDDLQPAVEGSVILGIGEPTIEGATGLVPVSLWCGGTCGTWFTYRLELIDGVWQVTGIEGPIAIS